MVWEYDSAGRRTGEMAAEGVLHVATLGNLLAVHGKEGVRVMKRAGSGKWACVKTLKVGRRSTALMEGTAGDDHCYGRRWESAGDMRR